MKAYDSDPFWLIGVRPETPALRLPLQHKKQS